MFIRIFKKLSENLKKLRTSITRKGQRNHEKKPVEIKNTASEMKNMLEGLNRLDEAEDQISDLVDRVAENTQ